MANIYRHMTEGMTLMTEVRVKFENGLGNVPKHHHETAYSSANTNL